VVWFASFSVYWRERFRMFLINDQRGGYVVNWKARLPWKASVH
jgi:hypothetical protein